MIRLARPEELADCLALRRKVFIEEQSVPEAEELDGRDAAAVHLLAFDAAGRPVGTARLLVKDGVGKIGRVCVLRQARGSGLGAGLIRAALAHFRTVPGLHTAMLGAQLHALGFYERLGFVGYGPHYLDAGIAHQDMELAL